MTTRCGRGARGGDGDRRSRRGGDDLQEPHQPRRHHHRRLLHDHPRHLPVLRAPRPYLRGLLPRQPQRRLVRDRCVAVRLEHLHRAFHRPRRLGRDLGPGRRPLRMAGVPHPADPRLGVRAVLPALQRVHHAGVPGAPLQPLLQRVPRQHLDPRLHFHQDLGAPVCRGHRARARRRLGSAHRSRGAGGGDGHLHDHRRPRRGDLHRAAADARAARGRGGAHLDRLVRSRRFQRTARGAARALLPA